MEGNDSFEDYDEQLFNYLSKIEGLGSLKFLMNVSVGYLYIFVLVLYRVYEYMDIVKFFIKNLIMYNLYFLKLDYGVKS